MSNEYDMNLEEYYADEYYKNLPRCENCGCVLKKFFEHGEAWGSPYSHEYWECPNCDDC